MHIHYDVVGVGPPIVLVHGWGADSRRNWVDTGWVDALAPIRQVVLIDSRGHGLSDKPHVQAAYSYLAMGGEVLQVMDEIGIEQADFLGYSMGAFIGAGLLGRAAERFSSMVLGGIGDETPESAAVCIRVAEGLRAPDPAGISDPVGRAYRAFVDAGEDGGAPTDREALALAALQMWPEGHPVELGGPGLLKATQPVLLVNGSDDHPYVDTVDRLAAALPGATVVTIPGADHLTAVSDPRLKAVVVDFLTRAS